MTPAAWAERPDKAKAEADRQFEQGKAALQRGEWPEACERFRRSMALDRSASTLVKLARCHEHDGQLKAASDGYAQALSLLRDRREDDEHARLLLELVRSSKQKIDARLGRVLVRLNFRPSQFRLLVDGQEVAPTPEQPALLVEPGTHSVGVIALGFSSEPVTLTLAGGETQEIVLILKPVETGGAPAIAPRSSASPMVPRSSPLPVAPRPEAPTQVVNSATYAGQGPRAPIGAVTPVHRRPSSGNGQRVAAAVTGAPGLVLLGVAGYFGLRTRKLVDDARVDNHCDANYACDLEGKARMNEAERKQTYALLFAGGGTVLLGTGLVLWLTASPSKARMDGQRARLTLNLHATSVTLGGNW